MKRAIMALAAIVLIGASLPLQAAPRCDPRTPSLPAGAIGEPDCRPPKPAAPAPPRMESKVAPGGVDVGNGMEIRIGGRVRAEADTRR